MKITDEIFQWKGWANGYGNWISFCRIRIYQDQGKTIVIASDCGPESGTSITNCVENLVPLVMINYQLNPYQTFWIEHYPQSQCKDFDESFSEVLLHRKGNKLCNPIWKHRKKEEIEKLIGQKLENHTNFQETK